MEEVFGISFEWIILIAVNAFLLIVLFGVTISTRRKLKKLTQKYYRFMNGLDDANMEDVLFDSIDKVNRVIEKNRQLELQLNKLERNLYYCVQKVGVVRYNAFDNVGSDLSYSVALLDNNDDGLVLSSLYARDSSSTYAKPVSGGKSKYALSAEEIKAIDIARKTHSSKKYTN